MRKAFPSLEVLIVILYAIVLAPTKYNFIRKEYMPSFISPSLILSLTILLGIMIMVLYRGGNLPIVPRRLWIPYAGLVGLMMVSLFYTPNLEYGVQKFFEFTFITSLTCFSPFFLFKNSYNVNFFLKTLCFMGIFLVVVLFFSRPDSYSDGFKTGLGSNYLLIQHVSGMAGLIILYYFILRAESYRYLAWLFILFVGTMGALLYVGGKGSVLAFVVTTFFMSSISIQIKSPFCIKMISRRQLVFPLMVIILFVYFIFIQGFSVFVTRFSFVLSSEHYSQIERIENAKIALDLFQEHPFFGVGIGGFSVFAYEMTGFEQFRYPHNITLEVLAELGLVGFMLSILIVFFSLKNIMSLQKKYGKLYRSKVFVALYIFTLLNAQTSGDIVNPALFAFIGASFTIKKE